MPIKDAAKIKLLTEDANRRAKIVTRMFLEWRVVFWKTTIAFRSHLMTKEQADRQQKRLSGDLRPLERMEVTLDLQQAAKLTKKGF